MFPVFGCKVKYLRKEILEFAEETSSAICQKVISSHFYEEMEGNGILIG